jgi:hypothetical protein
MNTFSLQSKRKPNHSTLGDSARSLIAKSEEQKQQFRAMIEPIVYRARQLGLNRVQIREVITSLL